MLLEDLACFRPVLVEFDNKFSNKYNIGNLSNIIAAFNIEDQNAIDVFVTFMDPADIVGTEERELFQTTLEKVVDEYEFTFLDRPVKGQKLEEYLLGIDKFEKVTSDLNLPTHTSDIGYVQFTTSIASQTFEGVFLKLSHLIDLLETKTRERMKESKQLLNETNKSKNIKQVSQ